MTHKQKIQAAAYKEFKLHLDRAIEALYVAGIENRGDVLSLPIKDLHYQLVFGMEGRTAPKNNRGGRTPPTR
jgi:hypothetical protein